MKCEKCGAQKIQSKRTGTYYCVAKCWLGQQQQVQPSAPNQQQQQYLDRDDRLTMHEIEQRGIKSSVARQKAADTVNAMIAAGLIKTKDDIALALDFFASKNLDFLLGVK